MNATRPNISDPRAAALAAFLAWPAGVAREPAYHSRGALVPVALTLIVCLVLAAGSLALEVSLTGSGLGAWKLGHLLLFCHL